MAVEINITSNMTAAGTTISMDGKKPKGTLDYAQFSICKRIPLTEGGGEDEVEWDLNATLTYIEEDEETGASKRVTYNFHNHDEDTKVEDFTAKEAIPAILDMIKGSRGKFVKG